jgi:hypothetical protein
LSAHASLPPDALCAFDMNKSNGGKQREQLTPSFLIPTRIQPNMDSNRNWKMPVVGQKGSNLFLSVV